MKKEKGAVFVSFFFVFLFLLCQVLVSTMHIIILEKKDMCLFYYVTIIQVVIIDYQTETYFDYQVDTYFDSESY